MKIVLVRHGESEGNVQHVISDDPKRIVNLTVRGRAQAEAASATHDRELAGRAVQALVDLRADSRTAGDWGASDRLRDVLAGVGVEVRDSREGSTWQWM